MFVCACTGAKNSKSCINANNVFATQVIHALNFIRHIAYKLNIHTLFHECLLLRIKFLKH